MMLRPREEFNSQTLFNNLVGSLVVAIPEIFLGISLASLIFTGPLESSLPLGAGLVLITTALLFGFITSLSSRRGSIAIVQDVTAVLMTVITSSFAASVSKDQLLPTTLAALMVCTFLAGLMLVGIGILKLSRLIRYLPYPVLGGFLAATGYLLVTGSISSLTGIEVSFSTLPDYLQGEQVMLWLPALIIGIAMFLVGRKARNPLAFPGIVLGSIVIFYLVLALIGISNREAAEMGLLYPENTAISWQPFTPAMFSLVNWEAIFAQAGNIAALLGMTMIGLLINLSALEIVHGEEYQLNRELVVTGVTNLLIGMAGGFIGYHAVSMTSLARQVGLRSRLAGLVVAMLCLLTLWAGTAMLNLIPRPLISGILLFLGLEFLYDWVISGWRRFSRVEYLIVLLIMGIIIWTNFLTGIVIGLLAMVILFIVSYSQTKVYRLVASGAAMHSKVVRSTNQRLALSTHGEKIYILELQGFLFFGTANALLEQVKSRLQQQGLEPLRYLVLDFRMVTGIDTSAAIAFYKIAGLATEGGIRIALTNTTKEILARLGMGGFNTKSPDIHQAEDLDRGLEWCEDRLLESLDIDTAISPRSAVELFELEGMSQNDAEKMKAYLKREVFDKGTYLWHIGDPAEDLFYIARGRVSVYRETPDGDLIRLSTLSAGTTVGEIGVFLSTPRSAAVVADETTQGYRLTRTSLEAMQRDDPQLFTAFQRMIIRQLSGWVMQANQSLEEFRKGN